MGQEMLKTKEERKEENEITRSFDMRIAFMERKYPGIGDDRILGELCERWKKKPCNCDSKSMNTAKVILKDIDLSCPGAIIGTLRRNIISNLELLELEAVGADNMKVLLDHILANEVRQIMVEILKSHAKVALQDLEDVLIPAMKDELEGIEDFTNLLAIKQSKNGTSGWEKFTLGIAKFKSLNGKVREEMLGMAQEAIDEVQSQLEAYLENSDHKPIWAKLLIPGEDEFGNKMKVAETYDAEEPSRLLRQDGFALSGDAIKNKNYIRSNVVLQANERVANAEKEYYKIPGEQIKKSKRKL